MPSVIMQNVVMLTVEAPLLKRWCGRISSQ
jgi:hypothetical protein